jgi:hypothetical protein
MRRGTLITPPRWPGGIRLADAGLGQLRRQLGCKTTRYGCLTMSTHTRSRDGNGCVQLGQTATKR